MSFPSARSQIGQYLIMEIMAVHQLTNTYDDPCGTKEYEGNNRWQKGTIFFKSNMYWWEISLTVWSSCCGRFTHCNDLHAEPLWNFLNAYYFLSAYFCSDLIFHWDIICLQENMQLSSVNLIKFVKYEFLGELQLTQLKNCSVPSCFLLCPVKSASQIPGPWMSKHFSIFPRNAAIPFHN